MEKEVNDSSSHRRIGRESFEGQQKKLCARARRVYLTGVYVFYTFQRIESSHKGKSKHSQGLSKVLAWPLRTNKL